MKCSCSLFIVCRYDDDEALDFNGLDNHADTVLVQKNTEQLTGLQDLWLKLEYAKVVLDQLHSFLGDIEENVCAAIPDVACGLACVNTPAKAFCYVAAIALSSAAHLILVGADIAFQTVNREFETDTLGPDEAIEGYEYSKATYEDLQAHNKWNHGALTNINRNIQSQHTSMRQHLQDRHSAMEENIGEEISESRNALGQAIISSQNAIGEALVDSQNANGQLIVDAQNANGQAIVDARNAMSDQHNAMLEWLQTNFCALCVGPDCACERFIGPLEDDQTHIPLHLHRPEGQATLMEKLHQIEMKGDSVQEDIQRALGIGEDDARSLHSIGMETAIEGNMKVFEGDLKLIVGNMQAVEGNMQAVEGNMKAVKDKVDAIEGNMQAQSAETKQMKDMMLHLIEQNTKLMQQMEHKNMNNGLLIEEME